MMADVAFHVQIIQEANLIINIVDMTLVIEVKLLTRMDYVFLVKKGQHLIYIDEYVREILVMTDQLYKKMDLVKFVHLTQELQTTILNALRSHVMIISSELLMVNAQNVEITQLQIGNKYLAFL